MEYTQHTPAPVPLFRIAEQGYDYGQVDRYVQKLQEEYNALLTEYEKLRQYANTLQNSNAQLERETQRLQSQNANQEVSAAGTLYEAQAMAQRIITQARADADQQSAEAQRQLNLLLAERNRIYGTLDAVCKQAMEVMESISGQ
jgi:cell division septum initiation protein DivIVA